MATVNLPSGKTAEVADVDELTAGTKLAVQRAVQVSVSKGGSFITSLALSEEMRVVALAKLVKSWTHEFAVTVANIEKLPVKDYNTLVDAIEEHMKLLGSKPDKSPAPED